MTRTPTNVELNTHIIKTDAYTKNQTQIHTQKNKRTHNYNRPGNAYTQNKIYTHIEPDRGATKTNTHTRAHRSKHVCS